MTLFDQNKTPYTPSYFNTPGLKGDDLKAKQEKVVGQAGEILHIFAMHPHQKFTPWDIYNRLQGKYPITSIRARITAGPYKTACYSWTFNTKQL